MTTPLRADEQEPTSPPTPTVADVTRIAAHPDPVIRNLMITHCYHALSRALTDFTGGSANWCTFAVWASKQVGQTIRQEDPRRLAERLLTASPESSAIATLLTGVLRRALPHQARQGAERLLHHTIATLTRLKPASDAGARGNLKVFAEIAHEFARFLTEFAHDQTPDNQRITAFCATLRPGPPPNGQHYLQQAFTHYYRARFTEDPKARTELLLLANIEVGLHEQTRLQPEIAAALAAPILTFHSLTPHPLPPNLPPFPPAPSHPAPSKHLTPHPMPSHPP
ncbi:hypothetical protein L6E12_16390, partial [Actinokineospora sp. PR83]|uniref:hypothetical protein n=1 Tax=Actinokineospora sp. PR83 TaxID=2884908 RepID=UPI001F1F396A